MTNINITKDEKLEFVNMGIIKNSDDLDITIQKDTVEFEIVLEGIDGQNSGSFDIPLSKLEELIKLSKEV